MPSRQELYINNDVWARFYRDHKTLGEIAEEFKCSIYDLSPWLTAPMTQNAIHVPYLTPDEWKLVLHGMECAGQSPGFQTKNNPLAWTVEYSRVLKKVSAVVSSKFPDEWLKVV